MSQITILPPELVNQIAAGEVVERPASVIKELVENAMDAGATRIEIDARDGGRQLRVADDGCGMSPDDLQVAFKNHATSKVKSLEDLFNLNTLGFRGEALASIAAIAKVTCTSRTPQSELGAKALVYPSGDVSLSEAGCAVGTVFDVQDLFYNVPARLKFLKRPQTELAHISDMVQQLALSHPDVAVVLKLEGSVTLKTSGSGDLNKTIQEVFALSAQETMLSFKQVDDSAGYEVWGQSSTPNVTRGSKKWMTILVNGRAIRCPILTKAIESAYDGLMVPGKYPVTVLFLTLPPDEVDVNVHPTKKEVKYQHANTLFSFVRSALTQALGQQQWSASLPTQPSEGPRAAIVTSPYSQAQLKPVVSVHHPPTSAPFNTVLSASSHDAMGLYQPLQNNVTNQDETAFQRMEAQQADLFQSQQNTPSWRVMGQLANTYILLETAEGLLWVDQHIAAERVQFERFMTQAEQLEPVSQTLLLPLTMAVSALQAAQLIENADVFESLGFQYNVSADAVHFKQVPALYNEKTVQNNISALLAQLEETGELKLNIVDVIATAACHSSIRAGDPLSIEQMNRVIAQWFACQRPWTCPHGRPVTHLTPHKEVMAWFERPSLPQPAMRQMTPPLVGA